MVGEDGRRVPLGWVLPGLILLATMSVIGSRAAADFTIHPTVELYVTKGVSSGVIIESVNVRCSGLIDEPVEAPYVSDSGDTMFFNGTGPTYPDSFPLCRDARSGRWRSTAAIGLAGLLLAGCAVVAQRIVRRRVDDDRVPLDARV